MKVVDFRPEHLLKINIQEKQLETAGEIDLQYGRGLLAAGPAITGMIGDEIIFCGGKAKQWEGRYILWAVLSKAASKHMVRATKIARRMIALQEEDCRLEAIVRSDFDQGHRWAHMLGLQWHHHEEKFLPGGFDADIYVRLQ